MAQRVKNRNGQAKLSVWQRLSELKPCSGVSRGGQRGAIAPPKFPIAPPNI
ncbi:MAG: hypothetical protein GY820_02155 [Gammaproteobacteria bacterium]|nr:hypothetical protein [Gammaproteobacteria bacterium]